jgi:hypothetical protein
VHAADGAPVTRIAFSSCLWTESILSQPDVANRFWSDVRLVLIWQQDSHEHAAEGAPVTRIAFSSCFWTESILSQPDVASRFWSDVRLALIWQQMVLLAKG